MINIYVYNHPFKRIRNREHEGVDDRVWGNVKRLSELGDFSYEQGFDGVFIVASLLSEVSIIFIF